MKVGIASGFIDEKLLSWTFQKTIYLLVFAWPIMFKGDDDSKDDVAVHDNDES